MKNKKQPKTLSHFHKINLIFREIDPRQQRQKLDHLQAHG